MPTTIIPEFDTKDEGRIDELEHRLRLLENHWYLKDLKTGKDKPRLHALVSFSGEVDGRYIIDITPIHYEAVIRTSKFSSSGRNGSEVRLGIEYENDHQQITINHNLVYRIHFKEPPEEPQR